MFARVVECQAKDGRGVQISTRVTNDVLPILPEQPGFIDFFALSDKTNAERLLCISLWTSREDAEEYRRRHYDTIANMLTPVLVSPPTLKMFTASASTVHRIARAAQRHTQACQSSPRFRGALARFQKLSRTENRFIADANNHVV
jgi:heme-degrading monooxygenase HmoA